MINSNLQQTCLIIIWKINNWAEEEKIFLFRNLWK